MGIRRRPGPAVDRQRDLADRAGEQRCGHPVLGHVDGGVLVAEQVLLDMNADITSAWRRPA